MAGNILSTLFGTNPSRTTATVPIPAQKTVAGVMHVVIFGAGLVGTALGRHIADQGHDVWFIESNPETVHKLRERYDVQIVQGSAEDPKVLEEAGISRADLVLVVTNFDKTNIILTLIARSLNPTARIIMRLRGEEYLNNKLLWQSANLADTVIISPEHSVIEKAMAILEVQQAFDVAEFADGAIRVAGFRLEEDSPLIGKPLKEAVPRFDRRILVVTVDRDGAVFVPTGNTALRIGDRVFVTVLAGVNMAALLSVFGKEYRTQPKFVLAPLPEPFFVIAKELEAKGHEPVLLEPDFNRCRELAAELKETVIIHGDVADTGLLQRIVNKDTIFLSVTPTQEVNFLVSMLARKLGAVRAITMMDNEAYMAMAPSLDVDAVLSPRLSAVGAILRYIHMGRILDSAMLLGGQINLLLVELESGSKLDGIPIRQVAFPSGVLIAAAIQAGRAVVPHGEMILHAGDRVLLVTPILKTLSTLNELIVQKH